MRRDFTLQINLNAPAGGKVLKLAALQPVALAVS
jgi:hypothetical protein